MDGLVGKLLNLFENFIDVLAYWDVILAFVGMFIFGGKILTTGAPKGLWNARNMFLQPFCRFPDMDRLLPG